MSVCRLSAYLSICPSVHPTIPLSHRPSVLPSVHPVVHPFVSPSVRPTVRLTVRPSNRPSIHLWIGIYSAPLSFQDFSMALPSQNLIKKKAGQSSPRSIKPYSLLWQCIRYHYPLM